MPRVLVVDDEPEILQFIGGALQDEGITVVTASDGREAVDAAARGQPDLVILDMMLPRLDGVGVAAELRRLYGDLPIVVITAGGTGPQKAKQINAIDFLAKPFDLDQLLAIVEHQLSGSV